MENKQNLDDVVLAQKPKGLSKVRRALMNGLVSAALTFGFGSAVGCGGGGPTGPIVPTPVTMNIDYVNSYDNNHFGSTSITANLSDPVVIPLPTGAGLDRNYGALREAGMPLAALVVTTSNGAINTTAMQGNYELFVHSSLASDVYPCGLTPNRPHGTNPPVRRLKAGESFPAPGVVLTDGPSDGNAIIGEGIALINDALNANGRQYASLSWTPNASTAAMAGGFGTGIPNQGTAYHSGNMFVIGYDEGVVRASLVDATLEEAGESYFGRNDACGLKMTQITCPGGLGECAMNGTMSDKGKAWFRANATNAP